MKIYKSDVKFYPDEMKSKIQLALIGDNDLHLNFITSNDPENMIKLYNVFDVFSVNELKNKYCRAYIDEKTNEVNYLKNIIYDYDNLKIDKEEKNELNG